ncbi:MAG: M23 family metallopeptidase [Treponema sp.]|nr:M23 family metallopeptidase [Treponema sp.]
MKRIYRLVIPFFLCLHFFLSMQAAAQQGQIRHALFPENPRPGEPVTIAVNSVNPVRHALLIAGGQRLARAVFFSVPADEGEQSFAAAVITVPSTAKPGAAAIRVEGHLGTLIEIPLNIESRNFGSEVIELNQTLTGIRTDSSAQRTTESNQLWTLLSHTGTAVYFTGAFRAPVDSVRRTSLFGDRRVFKYSNGTSDTSIHAGVDFGVPTGTPVTACGGGRVVLARPRIVTGNSVVIEHLPGVYSLYYHLDKIEVAEGAIVSAGALLGLSGSTGLATGPHLHWEIRIFGENTDPDAFINRPILDKDAILSRISN